MPDKSSKALLEKLISYDTTSSKSNLNLIDFIRNYLEDHGIASHLSHDDEGRKANLFATIGENAAAGILLSGHTDVVPITGQHWNSDPYTLTDKGDGRLYGRGSCDMKGFIAVCLHFLPDWVSTRLREPIHLAFSYDEEVGCLGVSRMIDNMHALGVAPRACIIGEPTSMQVYTAHKGGFSQRCKVIGHSCHSGLLNSGVNAIEAAANAIGLLQDVKAEQQRIEDASFDPPYTSIQTGTIAGGIALNIVPNSCEFHYEIRNLPEADPVEIAAQFRARVEAELLPAMQAVHAESGFQWEEPRTYPGLSTDSNSEVVRLAMELTGNTELAKASYGTEAGYFQQASFPSVICGPGSIKQAHKPDEFITHEQLRACEEMMANLTAKIID